MNQMIEHVRPDYINKDFLIEASHNNYRVDLGGERYYVRVLEDGTVLGPRPSFTTVKNKCSPTPYPLLAWYVDHGFEWTSNYLEHSANYGTYFHVLCGKYLRGDTVSMDNLWFLADITGFFAKQSLDIEGCLKWVQQEKRSLQKDFYGFARFCEDYKIVPIAIEYPLFGERIACTLDIVCKMEIKGAELTALIDIKSGLKSFYMDHEVQLHTQKKLWEAEHPDISIDKVYNYGCHDYRLPLKPTVTPYKLKDQTKSEHIYLMEHWLNIFEGMPKSETKKIDFGLDITLNIKKEVPTSIFETIDVMDNFKKEEVNGESTSSKKENG
jgi:hypothetical protein